MGRVTENDVLYSRQAPSTIARAINEGNGDKAEIQALTAIADPATATAEDVATKLNSVIAALKA